ncbi:hypothetical protein TrCOL_g386, partial [Triparma columacea]
MEAISGGEVGNWVVDVMGTEEGEEVRGRRERVEGSIQGEGLDRRTLEGREGKYATEGGGGGRGGEIVVTVPVKRGHVIVFKDGIVLTDSKGEVAREWTGKVGAYVRWGRWGDEEVAVGNLDGIVWRCGITEGEGAVIERLGTVREFKGTWGRRGVIWGEEGKVRVLGEDGEGI